MESQQALQRVPFYDQEIMVIVKGNQLFVAMKPICENLAIEWDTQRKKLEKLKRKFNYGHMTVVAADGKLRQMGCLPLEKLNGWLFTINPRKTNNPELIERYQEECFDVLYKYFHKGAAINPAIIAPEKVNKAQLIIDSAEYIDLLKTKIAYLESQRQGSASLGSAREASRDSAREASLSDMEKLVRVKLTPKQRWQRERELVKEYLQQYPSRTRVQIRFDLQLTVCDETLRHWITAMEQDLGQKLVRHKTPLTAAEKERIYELAALGKTYREIGEIIDRSAPTIAWIVGKMDSRLKATTTSGTNTNGGRHESNH